MDNKNIASFKERLRELFLEIGALKKGDFLLSSGRRSNYYLDARLVSLHPQGAYLIANIILHMLEKEDIDALGGPTLGADPIAAAVAVLSYEKGAPLPAFIVRKAAKEHGLQRQIEGAILKKGSRVVLVDDVVTSGKSLIEAKNALSEQGVEVVRAITIVDRLEGAAENLSCVGVRLSPILTIRDFGL